MPQEYMENLIRVKIEKTDNLNELTFFYNGHMRQMIAAEINMALFGKKDLKEVIAERPVKLPGSQQSVMQRITTQQALEQEKKQYQNNREIVDIILEKMKNYEQANSI